MFVRSITHRTGGGVDVERLADVLDSPAVLARGDAVDVMHHEMASLLGRMNAQKPRLIRLGHAPMAPGPPITKQTILSGPITLTIILQTSLL